MAHEEIKRPASAFRNAAKGSIIVFVDENGTPSIKDENGVVTPSATLDGSPVRVDEQGSDPTPIADAGHFYAKDVGGVSSPFFQGDDGQPIQLGEGGAPPLSFEDSTFAEGTTAIPAKSSAIVVIPIPADGNNKVYRLRINGVVITDDGEGKLVWLEYMVARDNGGVLYLPDLANRDFNNGNSPTTAMVAENGPNVELTFSIGGSETGYACWRWVLSPACMPAFTFSKPLA